MQIALWIVQVLLALVFVASGSMKLFAFDQFAASAPALADQRGLVIFIGICELAGAVGLVLPALTKIMPILTNYLGGGRAGNHYEADNRLSPLPWRAIAFGGHYHPSRPGRVCVVRPRISHLSASLIASTPYTLPLELEF